VVWVLRVAGIRRLLSGCAVLVISTCLLAQNPQLRLNNAGRFPTVIFSAVKWNADPSYYSIAIDSSGSATYLSAPRGTEKSGVPYSTEFQVSDRTRRIAFNLTQRLKYFGDSFGESQTSPGENNVYTLGYRYGGIRNQFTFSSSKDADIQELTSVFEELSQTFEYGRKLRELELHDRKNIESQLEAMKLKADRHALRDLPALVPILRGLASDGSLDLGIRSQACSLLKLAQNSGPTVLP
jgi:hypothetical protein